jgi:hypothetical protein
VRIPKNPLVRENPETMKKILLDTLRSFNANLRNSTKYARSPRGFLLIPLILVCFALCQQVQSATDTPDPGGPLPISNTADGQLALASITTGIYNSAFGIYSLLSLTDGDFCTAVGGATLLSNTGSRNTAVGAGALLSNTDSTANTAVGSFALFNNTGAANTAVGASAMSGNTTGSFNVAIGEGAGFGLTSGSNNTIVGEIAGGLITTANSVICIGAGGGNVSNSCFIGQIYSNVQPVVGTDPDLVTINSSGRLGRANVSSRRYKHDIKPMDKASEVLFALKPVSFHYNKEYDATQTIAFGLIAEEVAEINPDLVGRNPEGQPELVRYEQINAMLLNEFLKEHRKVQNLEATVADLVATVKEQAAQIQKVSAQLEVNKPAAQVVSYER